MQLMQNSSLQNTSTLKNTMDGHCKKKKKTKACLRLSGCQWTNIQRPGTTVLRRQLHPAEIVL